MHKMKILAMACAFLGALFGVIAGASAQSITILPGGCGSGNPSTNYPYFTVNSAGQLCDQQSYIYTHIATETTIPLKTGTGVLHTVCINTPAAGETITAYDSLTGSGAEIASATSYASVPGCLIYDAQFSTGLTVVTGTANGDVTVTWR
jgi:hypothetical protein